MISSWMTDVQGDSGKCFQAGAEYSGSCAHTDELALIAGEIEDSGNQLNKLLESSRKTAGQLCRTSRKRGCDDHDDFQNSSSCFETARGYLNYSTTRFLMLVSRNPVFVTRNTCSSDRHRQITPRTKISDSPVTRKQLFPGVSEPKNESHVPVLSTTSQETDT